MLQHLWGWRGYSINLAHVWGGMAQKSIQTTVRMILWKVVAPETWCHGLPQALPVCKLNHYGSWSVHPIKLGAPVTCFLFVLFFFPSANMNRRNQYRLQQYWSDAAGSYSELFVVVFLSLCLWTYWISTDPGSIVPGPACHGLSQAVHMNWLNWCRLEQQWSNKNERISDSQCVSSSSSTLSACIELTWV